MSDDLERVVAAMRAAGCRSSEERMLRTAAKRLATARRHQEKASAVREAARTSDPSDWLRRQYIEDALRLEVRAAERAGLVTRPVRDIALRRAPSWRASADELLNAAEAIALTP